MGPNMSHTQTWRTDRKTSALHFGNLRMPEKTKKKKTKKTAARCSPHKTHNICAAAVGQDSCGFAELLAVFWRSTAWFCFAQGFFCDLPSYFPSSPCSAIKNSISSHCHDGRNWSRLWAVVSVRENTLRESLDCNEAGGKIPCSAIAPQHSWTFLIVSLNYSPASSFVC